MVRIAIADNQLLFRQALCSLIKEFAGFALVADAATGADFLGKLKKLHHLPDIVLIDTELTGMNSRDLNQQLRVLFPAVKVIILGIVEDPLFISNIIAEGANAYLDKNCTKEELIMAINTVHETGLYINRHTLKALQFKPAAGVKHKKTAKAAPDKITKREVQVLQMICCELNTTEIAAKLYVSTRTVECHRNNLLAKTGCRNTAGLVLYAVKSGFYHIGNQ